MICTNSFLSLRFSMFSKDRSTSVNQWKCFRIAFAPRENLYFRRADRLFDRPRKAASEASQKRPRNVPDASKKRPRGIPEASQKRPAPDVREASQRRPRNVPEASQKSQKCPRGVPKASQKRLVNHTNWPCKPREQCKLRRGPRHTNLGPSRPASGGQN